MPSYRIAPYPSMRDPNVRVVDQPVSADLVKHIRMLGDERLAAHVEKGRVGLNEASAVNLARRDADTQWLLFPWDDPRTEPVYEALAEIVQQVNARTWQLDITDYVDMFHYIRYTAPTGHFEWHADAGDQWRRAQRKLSFSLILSDADEYEGGEFEFFDGHPQQVKARKPGDVLVFPAWLQHRVTPVTTGTRHSLVGWASGPKLR
jgi:PKHD-type hydroxylase